MTEPEASEPTDRREFVRSVTLGAAGVALMTHPTIADQPKKAADKPEKPSEQAARSEVDARMDLVLARFGKHEQLDEKARATIRGEIATLVSRAEALRKIPISNGEGPFPVFQPYRAPLV